MNVVLTILGIGVIMLALWVARRLIRKRDE